MPSYYATVLAAGKVDEKNEPHVGGNTWAGGTGGADTAGLGGKGGPYRLDAGHTVHQISDEEKAKVSAEISQKAREQASLIHPHWSQRQDLCGCAPRPCRSALNPLRT